MHMPAFTATRAPRPTGDAIASLTTPSFLRAALFIACAAAVAAAASTGQPSATLLADPELARLLRGMALLKAAMVLAAAGVVWWRVGRPVPLGMAATYVFGTAALAGASALIWQLSSIPMAALVFHAAGLALLVAAWRDGGSGGRRWRLTGR